MLALATGVLLSASAAAQELSSALPHTLHHGRPAGASVAPGVDWSRSRRGPLPAQLGVRWSRTLPGGVTANLLADGQGNVFAAGPNRVWQLGPDGVEQFARTLDRSLAVAAALLADGRRVVLAREGTLAGWSARGRLEFVVELQLPGGWPRGSLLPLPNGSLLVSAGAWLQQRDAMGQLLGHVQLPEPVTETLVSAGQVLVVTESGALSTWDGRSAPRALGTLSGPARAAALAGPERLLVLSERGALSEWDLASGEERAIAALADPGDPARLSIASPELAYALGSSGALFTLRLSAEAPGAEARALGSGPGELLSSSDEAVGWWLPNRPFTVQRPGDLQALDGVRCRQPISLVPAGSGDLALACRSGEVWRLGPMTEPGQPVGARVEPALPVGTRSIADLYSD